METEYQELKAFKAQVEEKEKDALIERFYMISDNDKKDIVENKANYTLEEIEAKLSVIYTKIKLIEEEAKNEDSNKEDVVLTYTLTDNTDSLPDWVKAVREVEENL